MAEAIFDAIEYDDIDSLEQLLEEEDDIESIINTPDHEGYSPLIVAASIGLVDIAETLLEHKANINYIAPDHASALFCAVQEKHWELVEVLCDFGADLNAQLDKGPTPLYIASQEGYADMAGHLVDKKANPDLRAHGITPLFIASQENHPEVCKVLLEKKADPNRRNKSGGLPIVVAAWRNNEKVLEELAKSPDIKLDKFGGANMSALMTAAKNKKTEAVKILIGAKADLDIKCDSSYRACAMHYAADKHYLEIMNLLKEAGADTSVKNANRHTPADVVMINFDEYLDGYAHTSLNLSADRQLKQLEKEPEKKKEPEPVVEPGTDSEIEDEEHLVGWSAPKEESISIKRVETEAEKQEKQELKRKQSSKKLNEPAASPKKSPKREKKKKEKKKKSKRSKKSSRKREQAAANADDSDNDNDNNNNDAGGRSTSLMSPEDRIQAMLAKNQNKLDVIREAFSDHDLDDSGYLDKPEFMACLGSLGIQEQYGRDFKDHVNRCFKEFDKDGNGRISFEEFVQFYNTINNPTRARVHRRTATHESIPSERPKAGGKRRASKGSGGGVDPSRGTNFLPTL
eukprot:INCI6206.1.p2 GENE.INCI6206.1~~INCI6206.1.p2  ORF type:complete len:573 (-),score=162.31 INCI6206.1:8379-10097(-)